MVSYRCIVSSGYLRAVSQDRSFLSCSSVIFRFMFNIVACSCLLTIVRYSKAFLYSILILVLLKTIWTPLVVFVIVAYKIQMEILVNKCQF